MPVLSIVIVNYNTRDPLRRCLQSIQAYAGFTDLEVIIVDNASTDGSSQMVHDTLPSAILIEPGHNTWFSGGNNWGFRQAQGDFIWILNADTQLQPDTLSTMMDYLKTHSAVSAVTCRMEYPEGGLQSTCSRTPQFMDLLLGYTFLGVLLTGWRDRRRALMWYSEWERDTTCPVEVAPGSNILARAEVIHHIGGFDEQLRLYFTEDDLCRRLVQHGEIVFVAGVKLLHEERASTRQVWRLASQIYFDDLLVYTRKYYGAVRALFLQALIWPTRWGMDIAQRLRGERKSM